MKKILLISLLLLMALSGCGSRKQSDSECLYCSSQASYDYEIDGNTISLCDECYQKEMDQHSQVQEDLKD